ncbi:MAG: Na/Pi symporter [Acidimicrobiaceae bacterium]|nr:Na/Pi symporter [Acidimicrobiaceae bacterium]
MEYIEVLMAGLTAIILFVFGLENFSAEIERISGDKFRRFIGRATRLPMIGVLIGALVTALIQSSSATSVIAVSLVNGGVLSFQNSVGVIFGANIGSTITAQLVAFKLTAFAPVMIILGFALSFVRSRISIFGKSLFFFGFVFFSLNLISTSLGPLQDEPALIDYLTQPQNVLLAVLAGCLFTAVVQSSAVTTGLAIIFTQQGLLSLDNAVPLIVGANIGTTVTAVIAMVNMDFAAKKTALSHVLFNVGGVLLALPFLFAFGERLNDFDADPGVVLANVHLAFNVITTLIFLAFIKPFTRMVDRIFGEEKVEFERLVIPTFDDQTAFKAVRSDLRRNRDDLLAFLRETYSMVSLSIESGYRSIYDTAAKRVEYVAFLEKEYVAYFSQAVTTVVDEKESQDLLELNTQFDYLFQIYDSIDDIFNTKRALTTNYVELRGDILLMVREVSNETLGLFDDISRSLLKQRRPDVAEHSRELKALLDSIHRDMLRLLAQPDRPDAGAMSNFVSYSRRLQDKLMNLAALIDAETASSKGSSAAASKGSSKGSKPLNLDEP